jgi:hypothetical protein
MTLFFDGAVEVVPVGLDVGAVVAQDFEAESVGGAGPP